MGRKTEKPAEGVRGFGGLNWERAYTASFLAVSPARMGYVVIHPTLQASKFSKHTKALA